MAESHARRKLAAILSADAVGYSRLMAVDEAATVETLKQYRAVIRQIVERRSGRVVNAPGDALLAEFPSAVEAVQAAVDVQKSLEGRNVELGPERAMQFRIGINLGDVIEESDGTIYGDGVNIAARMEALAEAGRVCVSSTVFDAVEGKLPLGFDFLGEQQVKNIAKPVRVYRVRTERAAGNVGTKAALLRRWPWPAVAGLVLLGTIAAVGLWRYGDWARVTSEDPILALPTGPSIAVLPFANLSGDPDQEYFADGITEEIITELTRFRELFVLARNTTFQYKGQPVDVSKVGRQLRVRYVLEGSVRRAGGKIRVNAQLLDASSGGHLWAETYDRELTPSNVLAVQDEITEHVVAKIAEPYGAIFRAGVRETQRKATDNLTAYECVLHAREHVQTEVSPALHLRARDCLERAIELDRNYAEAWAWLSEMYLDEYRFGYNQRPDPKPLDRALTAARRAVALDPTSAMGHLTLASAHFFRRELDQFAVAAEQALALNPNNAFVLARLAVCFTGVGELERSVALTNKAIALNPHHPSWYYFTVFMHHYHKREYEEALMAAQKWNEPEFFWNQVHLAQAYAYLGRKSEAQAAVAKLLQLYPDFPKNAWKEWRIWLVSEDIIQHEAEGLRKAGLEIPSE